MRFQDRTVIVTGGAKGIGAGCVEVFAAEGALVAIVDRDLQSAQLLARQFPNRSIAIQADVMHSEQVQFAIEETVRWTGRIDCLVNNAGIHPPDTPIEQMPPVEALRVIQVNFLAGSNQHYSK